MVIDSVAFKRQGRFRLINVKANVYNQRRLRCIEHDLIGFALRMYTICFTYMLAST